MKKIFKIIILSTFLIVLLNGCNKKEEKNTSIIKTENEKNNINVEKEENNKPLESLNEVNIDFETHTIFKDGLATKYPSNEWTYLPKFSKDLIYAVLMYNNPKTKYGTNINITTISNNENYTLEQYGNITKEELSTIDPFTEILSSKLTRLGNKDVFYIESTSKITNDSLDLLISLNIITEQDIKDLGGREYLLASPPMNQICMLFNLNNQFFSVVGTFYDDTEREDILKCIKTLVQNFEIKENNNTSNQIHKISNNGNITEMNEIELDFNLAPADIVYGTAKYPYDDWDYYPIKGPVQVVLYLKDSQSETSVNIGILKESAYETLEEWAEDLKNKSKELNLNSTDNISEIRKFGNRDIYYIESTSKTTNESIDYLINSGLITEDIIEKNGGREAMLSQPETKQITMLLKDDKSSIVLTGSYNDETKKDDVLKCMKTLIQTLEIK